jgi:hypothetical protein
MRFPKTKDLRHFTKGFTRMSRRRFFMQRTNLPEWGSRKEKTTVHVLFNFFAMEKNMAKNVKRLQSQKDTGSEPTINVEKDDSASNVEVTQGVKQKLFCSSER